VRQVPWPGDEYTSDQDYMRSLVEAAKGRIAAIQKPLFIHN